MQVGSYIYDLSWKESGLECHYYLLWKFDDEVPRLVIIINSSHNISIIICIVVKHLCH